MSHSSEKGMTLMELLISMAILSMMMWLAWSTSSGTAQIKRGIETSQQRNHEIRLSLSRLVSDLSSAYISANEDQNQNERRTMFIAKSSGDVDELRFSSFAHRPTWANAKESEQTLIAYYAERDPDDPGKTNLIRRESRRLANKPWKGEKGEIDVLLRDVEEVKFEYWDWKAKDWKDSWNSTASDGEKGRLPTRVRVTIELENDAGDVRKYVTQARIMMSEELNFFIN